MAVNGEEKFPGLEYSDIDEWEDAEDDSDAELQEKFARGELKPGLHRVTEKVKKEYKNNVRGLTEKLEEIHLKLSWVERLDLASEPAPLAPELNAEIIQHGQTREKRMKSQNKHFVLEDDPVHNDFKREMTFYRQAQAAVLEGFSKLQKEGLPTLRPSDYFAQMAKSDDHMQKVRKRLMHKQIGQQISERVKKIREIKKYGKKVQVEAEQQKHREKREMLEKIKKFRKGKTDTIDFLEEGGAPLRQGAAGGMTKGQAKKELKRAKMKRNNKDKKYGFGGKKRNSKRNTAKSHRDEGSLPAMRKAGGASKRGPNGKGNKGRPKSKGNRNKGRTRK